jgi:oligoendopeptidase F
MENELQKPTVDLVMRLCKEKQDLVARYYRVKREIMGLPELTHIDRYAPLFETKEQISYDDARTLIIEAFGQFSGEMSQRADEFFDKNWIDAEPRNGKTGGAFCSYNTPDTHPVIMMSYLNKMDNVMTLAHELGHGVHASLSRAQSYFNFHGTLPLAELASIFGEQVVFDRLVKEASEGDKLALYAEKIEGTFASVFRQAAMFRFEQRCHNLRREEGELNAEEIGAVWQDELQGMFGDSVKMGDQHSAWWSYVGHFIFAPFYVYAYSFGELLSMSLYSRAQKEGPEFEAKYIKMLEMGGSKTPEELMAFVGVNLDDEAFWLGGFEAIESMISTFEGLWAATK